VGPRIVKDIEPNKVKIQSYLNGQLRQDSNTSNFIFNVEELVSFVSHVMTLRPGDIIATGTPSGIGAMEKGDTVEIKIEGIGTLRNYVF
jgi:2-keto-4-pentenoate hydratase/2-oxohepta-3-ene-1,7-dioic acid hydratase in catechol pathway